MLPWGLGGLWALAELPLLLPPPWGLGGLGGFEEFLPDTEPVRDPNGGVESCALSVVDTLLSLVLVLFLKERLSEPLLSEAALELMSGEPSDDSNTTQLSSPTTFSSVSKTLTGSEGLSFSWGGGLEPIRRRGRPKMLSFSQVAVLLGGELSPRLSPSLTAN